jgi:hypothetical protein
MEELSIKENVNENSLIKFEQFNNVTEQLAYAKLLIDSGLVQFKKPEQVVMIANLGRSLGVSFDVACQNINSIQGKPAISVHLITALARKAGIDWELIKDCEQVINKEGKVADLITTIRFFRFNDKLKRVITNDISYTWNDAVKAGYATKTNWKEKPKNMLRARCISEGVRFVGSDVLMGVFYEQGEMLDATNQVFDIDAEGNVIQK